jgi:VWFA-related protein
MLLVLLAPAPARAGQAAPQFSSRADLVVLHATVKDRRGAYVPGLTQDSFLLYEDGHPQQIQLFTSEDAPVTVGLLIDSSGSMQAIRPRVVAAAAAFAEASNPRDELFALAFNDYVTPALPAASPFTSDVNVLRQSLARLPQTLGRTAMYDAVLAGLEYLGRSANDRRILVIVSDGGDNASHVTFDSVLTKTQASNVVIYTVALMDPVDGSGNPRLLKQLAAASGGEAFEPRDADQIQDVLRRVARDIRNSYTLGYVSTNTARDGTFRKLRVGVAATDRGRLIVRTRSGYVAGGKEDAR